MMMKNNCELDESFRWSNTTGEQESERPFSKRNYEKARAQQVISSVRSEGYWGGAAVARLTPDDIWSTIFWTNPRHKVPTGDSAFKSV
jgi:hypothetical protein